MVGKRSFDDSLGVFVIDIALDIGMGIGMGIGTGMVVVVVIVVVLVVALILVVVLLDLRVGENILVWALVPILFRIKSVLSVVVIKISRRCSVSWFLLR